LVDESIRRVFDFSGKARYRPCPVRRVGANYVGLELRQVEPDNPVIEPFRCGLDFGVWFEQVLKLRD
jgi:hypothetical protein